MISIPNYQNGTQVIMRTKLGKTLILLQQLIDQPTHVINYKLSCINLLFRTNGKLLCDAGVELTIYDKCHHKVIYGSLNLSIPLPRPYYREVCDYKNTCLISIQRAIPLVKWSDV